jgi:hypothetical protein
MGQFDPEMVSEKAHAAYERKLAAYSKAAEAHEARVQKMDDAYEAKLESFTERADHWESTGRNGREPEIPEPPIYPLHPQEPEPPEPTPPPRPRMNREEMLNFARFSASLTVLFGRSVSKEELEAAMALLQEYSLKFLEVCQKEDTLADGLPDLVILALRFGCSDAESPLRKPRWRAHS